MVRLSQNCGNKIEEHNFFPLKYLCSYQDGYRIALKIHLESIRKSKCRAVTDMQRQQRCPKCYALPREMASIQIVLQKITLEFFPPVPHDLNPIVALYS